MQEHSFTPHLSTLWLSFSQLRKRDDLGAKLHGDLFGGTVAALIAVPYGMALSVAMGMRPEAGLYTSIIGGLVAGFLSSSPVLISGLSATAVPGVGIGFLIAMMLFVERAAESTRLEAVATTLPYFTNANESGVRAFRLTGPLFFATSERVLSQLKAEPTIEVLVLDLTATGTADSSAIALLRAVFAMQQERGGDLFITGIDPHLYEMFAHNGLIAELGAQRFTLKSEATKESERFYTLFGSLLRSQNG